MNTGFFCEHELNELHEFSALAREGDFGTRDFFVTTNNSNYTNRSCVETSVNTKNIRVIREIRVQKNSD